MSDDGMLYEATVHEGAHCWRIGVRPDADLVLLTCAPITFALTPEMAAEIGGHLQEAAVRLRLGESYLSPVGPETPYLVMATPSITALQLRIGKAWVNMTGSTGEDLGYHLQVAGERAAHALAQGGDREAAA